MQRHHEPTTRTRHTSVNRPGRTLLLLAGIVGLAALLTPAVVEQVSYAVTKGQTRAVREQLAEMSKQDRLSPLFAAVAEAVQPSVVEIRTQQKVSMRRRGMMIPEPFRDQLPEEFRKRFFGPGGQGDDDDRQRHFWRQGQGSGVIVDAGKGYVLTNHHVVADSDKVEVILADGRSIETDWVRSDPLTDVAVVKIDADNLIAAPLGDSDEVTVGHWTLAIGAPSGLAQTVTAGIISGVKRSETARGPLGDPRKYRNYIQTDAAINPGNSGGPLLDVSGEVIGINTAINSPSGGSVGIGFAVPSEVVKRVVPELIETGSYAHPAIGIRVAEIGTEVSAPSGSPVSRGLLVIDINENSPAADSNLRAAEASRSARGLVFSGGDIITAVNDQQVRSRSDLLLYLDSNHRPGDTVTLTVFRDGERRQIDVTLGTR